MANLREALELYFEDEPLPADVQPPIIAWPFAGWQTALAG